MRVPSASGRLDAAIAAVAGRLPGPVRKLGKRRAELAYWKSRIAEEGSLSGPHYERFFTTYFSLTRADYAGKRVLDIGCGPRGSLEWASEAAERVGLDPLAGDYLKLGAAGHSMTYVEGGAEAIPFGDGHFDVVSSFNSLDHVDDLGRAVSEITRVTAGGGTFLLVTEFGHAPTFTEPQSFGWEVLERFKDGWEVAHTHRVASRGGMMESLDAGEELDARHSAGYLVARMRRLPRA